MITKAIVSRLLGLVLSSGSLVGCSSVPPGIASRAESSGSVALRLHLDAEVDLLGVTFAIQQRTLLPQGRTGAVDVSRSQSIQFVVGGLPAGAGYTITLTGTLHGAAGSPCSGSARFDVIADATTPVAVALVCGTGAPDAGGGGVVVVNASSTEAALCAAVTSLSASPARADVGSTMRLSAAGVDSSGVDTDVRLRWSLGASPIGSLGTTSGSTTAFTCFAPGSETVTLAASVGDAPACAGTESTASVTVVCDAVCTRVLRASSPLPTGLGPVALAVGDLNGDAIQDFVVANSAFGRPGTVSVLLGQGDGTFRPQVVYASGGNVPSSVAVADLNGDGKLDVAVTHYNSNNVGVLLGKGDGTLGVPVVYATGSFPSMVASGDLNGDGKPDLVVADFGSDVIGPDVLLGNGDGTFRARAAYATDLGGANSVAIADLNGDGKPDLAVPTNSTNAVSVLLGNGDGTFLPHTALAAEASPWSIATGDLNGDGKVDLVVTNLNSNNLSVMLGHGDGTFQREAVYATGVLPWFVAIADMNGDGAPDLAVANNGDNDVGILLGLGDGTFREQTTYATGAFPSWLAVSDLNADGKLDLAATNQGGAGSVSVLLGSCAP